MVGEKVVDVAQDDDVEVEEECRAAQAVQVGGEGGEFAPAAFGQAVGQVKRGNGVADDSGVDAVRVVGEAVGGKRQGEVARNHAVQAVDVFGRVFVAPFHAEDMVFIHVFYCVFLVGIRRQYSGKVMATPLHFSHGKRGVRRVVTSLGMFFRQAAELVDEVLYCTAVFGRRVS